MLVPAIILLQDYSNMLMHVFLLFSFLAYLHSLAMKHPFNSEGAKKLDRTSEAILYLAALIQIACMAAFNTSSSDVQEEFDKHEMLEVFGLINLCLPALYASLSLLYLSLVTLRQVFLIVRQWYRRRKASKRRIKLQKKHEENQKIELAEQR